MPGVLKRAHDAIEPAGLDGAEDAPDRKRVARESLNGDGRPVNGAHFPEESTPVAGFAHAGITPDPALVATARELADADEAPELHHITGSYVPLTTLVDRLAQDTHNELEAAIAELADMQASQVNGYGTAHAAQINVQKKERLFNFAQAARVKFIKLLVLAQWSRDSAAVSRLIDMHSWILFRKQEFANAVNWMGELKRMTAVMKAPPPDLRTALEVLSTGKADWISDPIPLDPAPLSAAAMLKGLRTINTLLTIRLNLHETVPPAMMDFAIASGRATFRVHDEFELDVSIADEDPTSQLYFIDFRFAFAPCTAELPDGPVRDHIEGRMNETLKTDGLAGAYAYLHELVLTQKLLILRQQAFDLKRGRWSEQINVEPVHRAVVVQYWVNRPGKKSWIEIGIRRHRRKAGDGDDPVLGIRWHRHGEEIADHALELDAADLSLETLLKAAIATHTNYIFKETKRRLKKATIYQKGILTVKHRAHPTEPAECALKVQMSADRTIRLVQEPISGFFAISPTSELHSREEFQMNRLPDPAAGLRPRLSLLRCGGLLQTVRQLACVRRWNVVESYRPNGETIQRLFRADGALLAFYQVPRWERNWILALTSNGAGDKWWLVETQDAPRNPTPMDFASGAYQPLRKSVRINLNQDATLVFEPAHIALATVERTAAAVLAQFVDARELTLRKIPYAQRPSRSTHSPLVQPDLLVRYPLADPWCRDVVKSVVVGLARREGLATTVVSGTLARRIPNVAAFAAHLDQTLAFHPTNGTFAFRLQTRVGASSVGAVQARFARLGALVRLIHTAHTHQLAVTRLALDSFTFAYGASASPLDLPLHATILFPLDESTPPRLSLEAGNPHLRILDALNRLLAGSKAGFETLLATLTLTLPLQRAFSELEHRPRAPGVAVYILPRSAAAYHLKWTAPRVRFLLEVVFREQDSEKVIWLGSMQCQAVKDSGPAGKLPSKPAAKTPGKPSPESEDERARASVKQAWQDLCRTRGPGGSWDGLGVGISARVHGAQACLAHVDAVISAAVAAAGSAVVGGSSSDGTKAMGAGQEVISLDD